MKLTWCEALQWTPLRNQHSSTLAGPFISVSMTSTAEYLSASLYRHTYLAHDARSDSIHTGSKSTTGLIMGRGRVVILVQQVSCLSSFPCYWLMRWIIFSPPPHLWRVGWTIAWWRCWMIDGWAQLRKTLRFGSASFGTPGLQNKVHLTHRGLITRIYIIWLKAGSVKLVVSVTMHPNLIHQGITLRGWIKHSSVLCIAQAFGQHSSTLF